LTALRNYIDFLSRPDHEQLAIMLGTFALLHVIQHPHPTQAVARVNAFLRAELHARPNAGAYIKKKIRKR